MVDTEQQTEAEALTERLKELERMGVIIDRQGTKFCRYMGLLDLAHKEGLESIDTEIVQLPDESNGNTVMFKATVVTSKGRFTGHGDANVQNVGRMIADHFMRMAETRAKARALRDALNIGVTALEELGESNANAPAAPQAARPVQVPQAMLNDFEQQSGMQQTTAQRTNYNQPQGGQQGQQRQFQKATGPSGRPPSPKQLEHLNKNASFSAPGIPSHDEAVGDGGLASMRLDAIFGSRNSGGGSFR